MNELLLPLLVVSLKKKLAKIGRRREKEGGERKMYVVRGKKVGNMEKNGGWGKEIERKQ